MTNRVLFGIADSELAGEATALAEETGELVSAGTAASTGELFGFLEAGDVDVVVIHEQLGPLPMLEATRELTSRYPHVGVVLLVRDPGSELLRHALNAGARGVLSVPLSLEELHSDVVAAAMWSRSVRERVGRADEGGGFGGSLMVAVAGAKGGVGTTTVATHLALRATADEGKRVCLIDFDLQRGDVRSLLDFNHKRSVLDLVEVAEDVSTQHLQESLYPHPSGMRVLLPPEEGEDADDVGSHQARLILGAIRSRFDVIVVDVGSVVSEAAAVATEMADDVLVVTTPDALASRAANQLLALWERLQIRKDRMRVVVNRTSRHAEVQPDLLRQIVAAPLAETTLPAAFDHLQEAVNSGSPDRLDDGPLKRGLQRLANEVGVARAAPAVKRRGLFRRGDRGAVTAEFAGVLPMVVLVALLCLQMAFAGFTFLLGNHAAREGARVLAVDPLHAEEAAEDAIPSGWGGAVDAAIEGTDVMVVHMEIPAVVPMVGSVGDVSIRQGTVSELTPPPWQGVD